MAEKRDRMTVDFTGLVERIETFRDDASWKEMTFTQKVRVLLIEKLDTKEGDK